MKFCMNGWRKGLNQDVKALREIAQDILNGNDFDKDDLAIAVDAIITASNVINCVHQKDDENFILLEDMEVQHLDGWDD